MSNQKNNAAVTGNAAIDFQVKSGLSRLMAMENITVRHLPGAKTAMFHTKNRDLILPVWKDISEDLYDMLLVHEVGHALDTPVEGFSDAAKIAERRYGNDPVLVKKATQQVKHFMNVVEDARIDKRQKRRYPGSKRNYVAGYKELIARNFFGTQGKDINSYSFIDRLNIYFKSGFDLGINFNDTEKAFIKEMEAAETFEQVVDITERLFNYCADNNTSNMQMPSSDLCDDDNESDEQNNQKNDNKSQKGKNKSDEQKNADRSMNGDGESAEDDENTSDMKSKSGSEGNNDSENGKDNTKGKGDNGDDDGSGDGDDGDASDGADDGDGNGSSSSGDQDEENDKKSRSSEAGGNKVSEKLGPGSTNKNMANSPHIPECLTEQHAEEAREMFIYDDGYDYVYLDTPETNLDMIVDDYKVVIPQMDKAMTRLVKHGYDREKVWTNFMEFRSKENDSISFMVKEFEMRKAAETYARTRISKTGVIDTNKLHTYMYNDDIFRKISTVPEGKNHGFIMIIDWSGSMATNFEHTIKQLVALTMFCKRVQIPFEVYSFRDPISGEFPYTYCNKNRHCFTTNNTSTPYITFDDFKLRNILSSRMNTTTMNKAFEFLWAFGARWSLDCDPLNGTPLNQAIYAADKIVNEFRSKNKLQVVSTIILTDGGSNPSKFENLPQRTYNQRMGIYKQQRMFIRDHITKKMYSCNGNGYGYDMTATLLNILRDRTAAHIIGFYLTTSMRNVIYSSGAEAENDAKNKKTWADSGYIVSSQAGYDQYYIMNCSRQVSPADEELKVSTDMTKRKILSEFNKFVGKKKVNRAMLTEFIKKVTDENKKVA